MLAKGGSSLESVLISWTSSAQPCTASYVAKTIKDEGKTTLEKLQLFIVELQQ